jgi:hypothetical protein
VGYGLDGGCKQPSFAKRGPPLHWSAVSRGLGVYVLLSTSETDVETVALLGRRRLQAEKLRPSA